MRALPVALALALAAAGPAPAQSSAACAPPRDVSGALLRGLNAERAARSLPPLSLSPALAAVAAGHACAMAGPGLFGHRGPDGTAPADRIARGGCIARLSAENIAAGQPDAPAVLRSWMDSPGHRRNILLRQARLAGIGRAPQAEGGIPAPVWVLVLADRC